MTRLIVVTGLPATGKSTLASQLARRYGVPLIGKDSIKEPLLDVLGARNAQESRRLSDASFAVLFALTRQALASGRDLIIEGNFRPGEHEAALSSSARLAQILCACDEAERIARLNARANDPGRHAGHRDSQWVMQGTTVGAFLAISGEKWHFNGAGGEPAVERLFSAADAWWTAAAAA